VGQGKEEGTGEGEGSEEGGKIKMVPTIGLMIGAYILLRCCDLFGSAQARFSSPGARVFVILAACACFLVTGFLTLDLAITTLGRGTPAAAAPVESMESMQSRSLTPAERQEIRTQELRGLNELIRRGHETGGGLETKKKAVK
jgi:hypothetical protein